MAVAILLLLVANRLWPPVLHLQTYESMQPKALIAQVHCEQTGPSGTYRVTLTRLPIGHAGVRDVRRRMAPRRAHAGLTGLAAQLGLPDRLDRLSGRYLRTEPAVDTLACCGFGRIALPAFVPQFCPERRGRSG
ncbi:MAG: hypothetical protein IPJ97_16825 [Proteobacteria bacterium]|nr:hypothetical protein [Pseudomonadota bacterium]